MSLTASQQRRNVLLLAICQALFVCSQSTLFLVGGLVGFALAPDKAWATLPVTCTILGTALATVPASLYMRRLGRRTGFMTGACLAIVGGFVAAAAIATADFWLFSVGTFLFGCYHAFCQYYRFAAADAAEPAFKSKALSLVLAGGVIAGFIGPELANQTRELVDPFSYLATVLVLSLLALLALVLVSRTSLPRLSGEEQAASGRPIGTIMAQPRFLVAVLASMIGFGVMSLIMTATPLAMIGCGFHDSDAGFVIQWHILGMFGPSFFTGHLIARFGVPNVMAAGVAALAATLAFTLSGIEIGNFWLGLILLGIGWNFLFIGGSTLLTDCYAPAERAKTQAAHDFLVFATTASASLLSGTLLAGFGWTTVNLIAMPLVALAGLVVLGLAWSRRQARHPA
jgi:predicted MFS family arabinose efflux permease